MSFSPFAVVTASALALSIGWGIRGNFGHETGAMIPGALAAMASVLLSGRRDWVERIGWFAFFGAVGWSFGGSISYMQVIGYTHSGHSPSVLYGFASLFVIGFLWGVFGGAGTALPAVLDAERLHDLFKPVLAVFAAWLLQGMIVEQFESDPQFRHADPLYWYDTDWLGVLVAIGAVLILAAIRRKWDFGSSLIMHMAVGWWIGFAVLVLLLGWRMTPPRGDNWAGCLGMAAGLVVFFQRQRLSVLSYSALLAGTFGGVGFAFCQALKLIGIKSRWNTNWHSLLEQSYGLVNGVGIGVLMWVLSRNLPTSDVRTKSWSEPFSVWFVLVVVTYLNLVKNVERWVGAKAVPEMLHGIPALVWFQIGYALLALVIAAVLYARWRGSIPRLDSSPVVRGTILFLIFLWWMVIGNFERALVSFAPVRLVTEGVIFLNAILCTAVITMAPTREPAPKVSGISLRHAVVGLTSTFLACTALSWGITRAVWGDEFAGHSGKHVRFGPDATATKAKPSADKPHP